MTLVDELVGLESFDYTDPQMRGVRFHRAMEKLRASHWLVRGPFGYVVLDREAGEFFLRTRSATFPGMKIAEMFGVVDGPLHEEMRRNILHINGSDHARLRSLVNPALAPRAVERYRPAMRRFLRDLFVTAAGAGADGNGAVSVTCEFVQAFAKPYPSQVIAEVMGAPLEDAPRLHHWSNWIQRQFDAQSMMERRDEIEAAVQEFYEYARPLLERRRGDLGEDLISELLVAEAEGEKLTEEECLNLVLNVLIGGVDTTQSQLAHAVRLFAEHPEQWSALAEDPSLVAKAVEEVLRFEPVTPFTARIVEQELTFRDVTFPEGTIVLVCAFTGNRVLGEAAEDDETLGREHPTGDGGDGGGAFNIRAERRGARALTFGAGVHYCLGANLARAELEEALGFLAARMPKLELCWGPSLREHLGHIRTG
jgi:cytochrome P450